MPYGPQTLWPDHCIQGSLGSDFHSGLAWTRAELVIRKGFRPAIDSYSAFFENDHATPTGLAGYLQGARHRHADPGRPGDRLSASPSRRSMRSSTAFKTTVRLDACRGIDLNGSLETMLNRMRDAGVTLA